MEPQIIKIIITAVYVVVIYPAVRFVTNNLVNNVAKFNLYTESHSQAIKKTLNTVILFVSITVLISVWGVKTENLLVVISSVFAVIGVALFAQWSILSNITAGIVVYFSLNFKAGDKIKILDKDFMLEATIIDLKMFYIFLETDEGERIIYPNNLVLQKGIAVYKKERSGK